MTDSALSTEVKTVENPDILPQIGRWLEDYEEVVTILPVLAGLLVTSRLQLRGAQALMVNLLMAAIIRQLVRQLKQEAKANSPATNSTQAESPNNHQDNSPTATTTQTEDYTIVHSIPGRLRLRIPRLMTDVLYAKRLEKLLSDEQRVKSVRINRTAASLIIQYDPAGVSELELGMYLVSILELAETTAKPDENSVPDDSEATS
ncbi:HMA2 domain-containing protein [Limnospira platensis CENA597]|uniref:HMA2 domain-containing protein n=1 Tax=Limnospira platensis TaxID=118562 RepID=UPI003DA04FCD